MSARHLERLRGPADDAAATGARVVPLGGDLAHGTPDDRVVPPTLIFAPTDEMEVMREEIFGPLLRCGERRRPAPARGSCPARAFMLRPVQR